MRPTGDVFTVRFQLQPHSPQKGDQYEIVCSFEDGYAAFLAPLFEKLNDEAGKTIIFSNGATFGESDLGLLIQIVSTARKRMAVKGERWNVFDGYVEASQSKGQCQRKVRRDTYFKVTQHKMSSLLDKVDAATRRAKATGAYVSFNFWG